MRLKKYRKYRLKGVKKWSRWYAKGLQQYGNVENNILPIVEGIIFLFKVLEALDKLESLHKQSNIVNITLESRLCALRNECNRFQGMQISPRLSKDAKVVAAYPLKLDKLLNIFEKLSLLDHDIRWRGTHEQDFQHEMVRWKQLRVQAQKDKIVLFPIAFPYAPWRFLEMISAAPIVPFLAVPLFDTFVHGTFQRLSWCAIRHDMSIHYDMFKRTESFTCYDTREHHRLMKIVSVAVKDPYLRDLLFCIAHEIYDFAYMIKKNCLADDELLAKLRQANCITERLRVLFEINAEYGSILIDFDSLTEVNSVGQKYLKDVLVPLRTYFKKTVLSTT